MLSLTDLFAAVRWWAVLLLLGAAAAPLAHFLFQPLADRGYAFSKMLGLLLVSYLFWILGSLGFLSNHVGGMIIALLLVLGMSVWTNGPLSQPLAYLTWLGQNWRHVLLVELLFLAIFALWVWVRAQNPAIAATEKPMEFAFLNAVGRSPAFPPLDPWLSGYAISYYYFGYVMTSLVARLALVPEALAFNLGLAGLVAGTAVGAFGLVYNLIATARRRRTAVVWGLAAALALPIAGNMTILLELAHGNGVGSATFWQRLDVRDLNDAPTVSETPRYRSSAWWWWRSSRVIHEYHLSGRPEEGLEPIVEVPSFSFVLGDMHPHVLALPFALLSLAVALVWWLTAVPPAGWDNANWLRRLPGIVGSVGWPLYLLTAVVLGGLSFLNTWDVLIHLFVVLGAFFLAQWRQQGENSPKWSQTLTLAGLLILPAILLYLPFYIGFRSQAGAPYLLPMLMRPTRLAHFLLIFGLPLTAITTLLLLLAGRQRLKQWQTGVATAVGLVITLFLLMLFLGWVIASSAEGAGRVAGLVAELGLDLPPRPEGALALGWAATAVAALIGPILRARLAYPALTLLLTGLLALVVMVWSQTFADPRIPNGQKKANHTPALQLPATLPFVLLLIATGVLLTLGPEFVYLRDNFGFRLNTIFKFYYQAWILFGVAAPVALDYLWQLTRPGVQRLVPTAATAVYALGFGVALLFPFYAIQSRAAEYRGPVTAVDRQPATLNGQAQLARFDADDYAAITWLRENVSGTPTILEAVGGQYTQFARVSAHTGLPTVLGWAGHEFQWRGNSTDEPGRRDPLVREIYTARDLVSAAPLINELNVTYIYVGPLERSTYGQQGLVKFQEQLEVAYTNNSVTIYRWQPEN